MNVEKNSILDYAIQNTGVLESKEDNRDFVVGQTDVYIQHNIHLDDKNWLPYYPPGELQYGVYYDTMSCVTFSAIKVFSAKMNYLLKHKMLSIETTEWLYEKGYINEDGMFDASERFTSAMSGTTEEGNDARSVWNSMRHDGLVPEKMCPFNRDPSAPYEQRFGEWFRDPANITQEAIDLGKEFAEIIDVIYMREELDNVGNSLYESPVQVFISTRCEFDENNIQQRCGYGANHAVSQCDDSTPRGYIPLFDHYYISKSESNNEKFIRRVATNYKFFWSGYICHINEKNVLNNQNNNNEDMPNEIIKGSERPEVYEVGKDGKLRHIYNESVFAEGVAAGNWKNWDDLQVVPQAEIDSMEKGSAHAFIIK